MENQIEKAVEVHAHNEDNLKLSHHHVILPNQLFNAKKDFKLPCKIYLYKEHQSNPEPRECLVFKFESLFFITIEGIVKEGRLHNFERLGLPDNTNFRDYCELTPKYIQCVPAHVMDVSKGNHLNNKKNMIAHDWIVAALTELHLDYLVQDIREGNYVISPSPPSLKPKPGIVDQVVTGYGKMKSGLCSYLQSLVEPPQVVNIHKVVRLPFSGEDQPAVPTEYDTTPRKAVVIRHNFDDRCYLVFHFDGDDTFRTIKGVWDNDVLKPSFMKQRPDHNGGTYLEIASIETSPSELREYTLKNKFNYTDRKDMQHLTEEDWAKEMCTMLKVIEKWNEGSDWTYVQPPLYTVGPHLMRFKLGSSQ